ncbi:SDR family oxidoreductase [Vibrio sinaloensis]|uniref:SDR family oxidoreductase n=1 Tax=Photobacterium sp. (strain ATCC 43367) TaxID=379097 RepID=UPI00205588E3|nr:SDR family oxidoreductase [Vibrio sinaloensis]UPQ88632.1 SDR family oxidoreductase [Vibrio sinaloensis]
MIKTILITGCSTGIGYTCAHALQQRGYQVIASCRHQDDVERLRAEGLTTIQLDLNNSESIDQAVEETLKLTDGRLDALFNNGAYGQPGALEDLPTQALREQFESNFFGWHQLTKRVLPIMRQQGYGRIIQNSSVLGFAAMKYRGAYNASKFAIEGWSDTLRLELMGSGIHISLLEPGPIETQFRANALLAFKKWITIEGSVHQTQYQQQMARLDSDTSSKAFVLPTEACIAPVIHALESPKPKARYRVTTPTKVFAVLKRVLPTRLLDRILNQAA